jgi:signal transduction histidine kinase/CheY-like chemotaxis protein
MAHVWEHWVAVPTAHHPDAARRRRLLNVLLVGVGGLALLMLLAIGLFVALSPTDTYRADAARLALSALLVLCSVALAYLLNRCGAGELAGVLFLLIVTAVIATVDEPRHVVEGRALFLFTVPILMASVTLRPWASFAWAGLTSAIISAIAYTQLADFRQSQLVPIPTMVGFFGFALTAWLSARSLESALADLRRYQTHLEDLVQARTRALDAARRAAEHANQAKSAFLAQMSHELRTPLNAILGFAHLLAKAPNLSPEQRHDLQTIHTSGQHLLHLINDILDLAKIEAGRLGLRPTPVHLPAFLAEIAEVAAVRARQKDLAFHYTPDPALPDGVRADAGRLRQVLDNLLSNAVKYTPHGHVALRVTSPEYEVGDHGHALYAVLTFTVQDTGIGIAPEDRERIFQPFTRAPGVEHIEGTGLGLTLTREFVRLMGGDLHLDSAPGQGTTCAFTLSLPVTAAARAPAPDPRLPTGYQGPVRRVLVVDDHPENRALLARLLHAVGFAVTLAEDGASALQQATPGAFDAIFMDLKLPDHSGLAVTRQIRQHDPTVVIIAVSASVFPADRQASRDAGCDTFLPKPLVAAQVCDALRQHLDLTWVLDADPAPTPEPLEPIAGPEANRLRALVAQGDLQALTRYRCPATPRVARRVRQLAAEFDEAGVLQLLEDA